MGGMTGLPNHLLFGMGRRPTPRQFTSAHTPEWNSQRFFWRNVVGWGGIWDGGASCKWDERRSFGELPSHTCLA
ncbi:hypothetical protein CEXT_551511 [Caerostris extrusa]|uniref:Uncharacterized protein n=1 Tax=Caerostris extrusa TaxID=172846 RepID=A0AAV4SVY6_CAEEX|nr:hypothetical protein CEXT_551511 [Caerostris extrusa]